MAQRLDDQALASFLSCPPDQHVPQLKQFKKFVLGQTKSASEALSHAKYSFWLMNILISCLCLHRSAKDPSHESDYDLADSLT